MKNNNIKSFLSVNYFTEKSLFSFGILNALILSVLFVSFGNLKIIILISGLIFSIICSISFSLSLALLELLIFISFPIIGLEISVLFSFLVFFSFLLNHYDLSTKDFSNPLTKYLLIYIITVIPSLLNSINLPLTFFRSLNFISIIILWLIFSITVNTNKKITQFFNLFLVYLVLSSFYVSMRGIITQERFFGLGDVFFADLAGIGLQILIVKVLFKKGNKKAKNVLLLGVVLIALFVTQTRNSWISTFLTFLILISYLLVNAKRFDLRGSKIFTYSIQVIIILLTLFMFTNIYDSGISRRAENTTQKVVLSNDPKSVETNSLVTRAFIWHTALIAFERHPFIGIGFYSFPFESQLYYEIPKSFFKVYVEGRTAHSGYLALLTETGILGFIGFMILLIFTLKLALKSIKLSTSEEEKIISLIIFAFNVYITVSLIMTSAWFWGQQGVLFGILLGITSSNYKLLANKTQDIYAIR